MKRLIRAADDFYDGNDILDEIERDARNQEEWERSKLEESDNIRQEAYRKQLQAGARDKFNAYIGRKLDNNNVIRDYANKAENLIKGFQKSNPNYVIKYHKDWIDSRPYIVIDSIKVSLY